MPAAPPVIRYCVVTATLVEPRTTPPLSVNSTTMRLFAGSNGTVAVAVTNTEYVGVAPASTVLVALLPAGDRQAPVASVWQIDIASGKTSDGLGVAVMVSALPTFTADIAKAFEPFGPGKFKMPSPVGVATSATISGIGVAEADSNSVFNPTVIVAGALFVQS